MVSKEEAIKVIVQRGTGVIGPVRMMSLLGESGISIVDDQVKAEDMKTAYKEFTDSFAAIAPTTRITLKSLARMHDFKVLNELEEQEAKEKGEEKPKKRFWRLKNWNFFKR